MVVENSLGVVYMRREKEKVKVKKILPKEE